MLASPDMSVRGRIPLLVVTLLVVNGCGLGAKERLAERVIETPTRVRTAGTARVEMTTMLRPKKVLGGTNVVLRPVVVPPLEGSADFARRRAALAFTGSAAPTAPAPEDVPEIPGYGAIPEGGASGPVAGQTGGGSLAIVPDVAALSSDEPWLLYAEEAIYTRRTGRDAASARPWAVLDFASIDIPDREINPTLGFPALGPVFIVELLTGVLTGSISEEGTEEVGGVSTTRFEANCDREKATDDASDDELETFERIYRSMGLDSIVSPCRVWLDGEGVPRRVEVTFEQVVNRRNIFELVVTLELSEYGGAARVDLPGDDDIARVEGLGQLINAFAAPRG